MVHQSRILANKIAPGSFLQRASSRVFERVALELFAAYQEFLRLQALYPQKLKGWRFEANDRKAGFGLCSYKKRTIYVSVFQIEHGHTDREELIDTVRHEVAHALAGYRAKHGPVWKKWAVAVGARPSSRSSSSNGLSQTERVLAGEYKWVVICNDEIIKGFHRKPRGDFSQGWVRGRKKETQGKLKLIRAEEFSRYKKMV